MVVYLYDRSACLCHGQGPFCHPRPSSKYLTAPKERFCSFSPFTPESGKRLTFDNKICTFLPASEEAFEAGREEREAGTLQDALKSNKAIRSRLGARALVASLLFQAVELESQVCEFQEDGSEDLAHEHRDDYSRPHKDIELKLATVFGKLPDCLHLPRNSRSPEAIFVNVLVQMANICLHKTAVKMTRRPSSPAADFIQRLSQSRSVTAATHILAIFQLIDDTSMPMKNPILVFAVYTAGLVLLEDTVTWGTAQSRDGLNSLLQVLGENGQASPVARQLAARLLVESQQVGVDLTTADPIDA